LLLFVYIIKKIKKVRQCKELYIKYKTICIFSYNLTEVGEGVSCYDEGKAKGEEDGQHKMGHSHNLGEHLNNER